jgi:hypothetical protein
VSKRKTFVLTVVLALLQASRALATGTGFDWDPAFTTLEQALSGGFATAVGVGDSASPRSPLPCRMTPGSVFAP